MDKQQLRRKLRDDIGLALSRGQGMNRETIAAAAWRIIERLPRDQREAFDEWEITQLLSEFTEDLTGMGPLQKLLADPEVTEIMVNGPDIVFIEKGGVKRLSDVRFGDESHLRSIIERMITPSGRRVDESQPYADFSLADGSRVNVIIPPVTLGGAHVTIRKFLHTLSEVEDLVKRGTLDERMAEFLVACIRAKKNMLFAGATGSGKTTTLAVLSSYINPQERIVTIEDTPELNLRQQHVVQLLTRPPNIEGKGEVTLRDLLRNSLRMRPSRMLLGEIRGAEALDYLQALNSGHRGCSGVLHAASPADALYRLETLTLFAGLDLPIHAIRQQIASGLDILVQQDQLHDGSRKVTRITETRGMEGQQVVLQDLFRYELSSTDESGRTHGRFVAVAPPADLTFFSRKGITLSPSLFAE